MQDLINSTQDKHEKYIENINLKNIFLNSSAKYGFKNSSEFVAEAFSNPLFAKELNEVKLSTKAKEKLGIKKYINTFL